MASHSSIFCLENLMDRGAWQATVHGGHKRVEHDSVTEQHCSYQLSFFIPGL